MNGLNYYNEHDPKAAAWLRELIAQKLIPDGTVDTRSIVEVQPADLDGFAQCHFFAGIGGWALALQLAGVDPTRPLWSGSCPCQPFSDAGLRLGELDERHLWPAFYHLISQCHPPVVVGEQVASKAALQWLDGVFADLESSDYACAAADLCAASAGEEADIEIFCEFSGAVVHRGKGLVGAPHMRQRLFWVADADRGRLQQRHSGIWRLSEPDKSSSTCGLVVSHSAGREPGQSSTEAARHGDSIVAASGISGLVQSVSPRLEGHARHGDDGREPGRLDEKSDGPTSTAGGWSDFDIVPCTDGKARRVPRGIKPSIVLLDDGIFYRVADVLAEYITQAVNPISEYAKKTGTNVQETMLVLQSSIRAETLQWSPGRSREILREEVLLHFLRNISSTFDRATDDSCGEKEGSKENTRMLRDLRGIVSAQCSSYRRESEEQYGCKLADSLPALSQFLARCCETGESVASRENAANFPLATGVKGRTSLLKGYGNAIIPQLAAEFIKAFLET